MSPSPMPLLGVSTAIDRVRALVAKVARARLPVLIEGETGTGKELVANALHAHSGRRGRFVAFNVGAIPESIFESSVFGHVRGAFTGATSDADGFLTEADHGTAFFDEIGTLGPVQQGKLLRALETGTYRPVGARHDRRSDFRIVAACNELLMTQVELGGFRADLAHRLSGCVVVLPPLRERADDIPVLIRFFAEQNERSTLDFTRDAMGMLREYPWPGNVRELRMFVERVIAIGESPVVTTEDVQQLLVRTHRQPLRVGERTASYELEASFRASEIPPVLAALLEALRAARGDTVRAAQMLGVHRSTLYRRMKQFAVRVERDTGEPVVSSANIRADSREFAHRADTTIAPTIGKSVQNRHLANGMMRHD